MRLLIVSDVHGNRAALDAVLREPHDAVVCLGDLVGYGPEPAACVRWARSAAAASVQGNHDRALADGAPPGCRPEFATLAAATAGIGHTRLTAEQVGWLGALPHWAFLEVEGVRCLLVHATPTDPLYRYLGPDAAAWERELVAVDAELVLVGHTHLPFVLPLGGRRVVNPGSVGMPKDGDPRAAYAVLERGRLELKRAAYPIDETLAAYRGSGVADWAVAAMGTLLQTGTPSSSLRSVREPRQVAAG